MRNRRTSAARSKSEVHTMLINFQELYVLTQLCGLAMIALMGIWIGQHLDGLSLGDSPNQRFNWHPLFMTIGFIYLYGNAILVYAAFATCPSRC